MMREKIEQAIRAILPDAKFSVSRPSSFGHGDYATNAALVSKMDPQELADKLSIPGVEKVEVVGKFINFFLSHDAIVGEIKNPQIEQVYAGKKILVEYTDPNPFKEFHIGHLMSNAIGESVAHLLHHTGAEVVRANYQGDVGPHVAKALWGKMQKPDMSWGEAYVFGNESYESHKEEIDSINKKVYDKSDSAVNALYDEGRKKSLEHFEEIYKMLGTKFDLYFFESETSARGLDIVKTHPEIFEESDGARIFKGEHTRVFVNSLGLPTYEAKDLGLAEIKKEKVPFDFSITVTANEQDAYFRVVFEALARLHPEWEGQFKHISHGMMRFAEGKMSSRKGNVITGESLLRDLTEAARGKEDVAVGAIKYVVLKQGSNKDIIFDPEKSLSLEGDSGPYVQYAHVRALSLIKKAADAEVEGAPHEVSELERLLIHFPQVVAHAAKNLEPHYVTTYLTELASVFNSWYATERVIVDGKVSAPLLELVKAVERTLAQGLHILGIPAPEEM
ncbi:arginine--tRNA ligase [Candidatus Parcubacteria bacterium]|nr:arginine--tRNA ligase [Candidatus Parcubacteria bacterium]